MPSTSTRPGTSRTPPPTPNRPDRKPAARPTATSRAVSRRALTHATTPSTRPPPTPGPAARSGHQAGDDVHARGHDDDPVEVGQEGVEQHRSPDAPVAEVGVGHLVGH